MNAREFRDVAGFLMNSSDAKPFEEGVYRTSISRLYYYIFLELRDTILFSDYRKSIKSKLKGGRAHKLIREYLRNIGDFINNEELKDVAELLYDLHELREDADYETGKIIKKEDVERAAAYVEEIEDIIHRINYDGTVGDLENVLSYLRINGQLPQI